MQVEPSVIEKVNKYIVDEYTFWKDIYDGKYYDADVADGVNLNIVRSHIIEVKRYCEDVLGDNFLLYPDSYFFPIPAELPEDFMVYIHRLEHPLLGLVFNASLNPPVSEVFKFNWDEVLYQ